MINKSKMHYVPRNFANLLAKTPIVVGKICITMNNYQAVIERSKIEKSQYHTHFQ
jgi:hypothetical protein